MTCTGCPTRKTPAILVLQKARGPVSRSPSDVVRRHGHRFYEADVMEKESKTLEAFNGSSGDPPEPSFPQNDAWSETMMMNFINKTEEIEEKIESLQSAISEAKPEVGIGEADDQTTLLAEVDSEKTSIKKSVEAFSAEIDSLDEINLTKATALDRFSEKKKMRI